MAKDAHAQAKAYVKSVTDSQRRRGAAKISKEDFETAVDRAAAGFAQLTAARR